MKRRTWIVFCNAIIIALALSGIYKDVTFAREYGLVHPSWATVARQHVTNEVLAAILLLGVVTEFGNFRYTAVVNCLAYSCVALISIWTSLALLGDPAFVPTLFESVPLFLLSAFNLWLYLSSWRRNASD